MSDHANHQERSLLVLILDLTPTVWGERERQRTLQDRSRLSSGKKSIGPATLDSDVYPAVLSFLLAYSALQRDNCAVVIGVAGNHRCVLYPRKGRPMDDMVHSEIAEWGGSKIDPVAMNECLSLGIAEMVALCTFDCEKQLVMISGQSKVAEEKQNEGNETVGLKQDVDSSLHSGSGAAIIAATSLALCIINRFLVALNGGVSALENNLLQRREDQGILALIAGHYADSNSNGSKNDTLTSSMDGPQRKKGILSPRILILQASEDRTRDYNAFMNCIFAASKGDIVIDGCFLSSGISNQAKTSTFLEQACDSTGGIFSKPMGAAQVGGALTEVMMTVFLPSIRARQYLNLPKVTSVDYRARCFENTGESIDQGFVCSQCLSIFKAQPKETCLTCGAKIVTPVRRNDKIQ